MPRLRVLVAIPPHPFQPGDVIDVDQVDLPHQRVALGMCEWVDGPPQAEQAGREPEPETATSGPAETTARRPRRTQAASRSKASAKAAVKADPEPAPKPSKDKE